MDLLTTPYWMRRVSVRAYPGTQTVLAGHDVVIQCRDEGRMRREVYWSREGGMPLPQTATMEDGRLEISGVGRGDEGEYWCQATGSEDENGGRAISTVIVDSP